MKPKRSVDRLGRRAAILAVGCSLAFVVGCGGDDNSDTSTAAQGTQQAASTPDGAGACTSSAGQAIGDYTKPMQPALPTTPLPMKQLAGKTFWFIEPVHNTTIGAIAEGFAEAGKAAGVKTVIFDGKGNVATWNQGIAQAVSQGADGIVLQGITPDLVSGEFAKAQKKGIVMIDSFTGSPDDPLNGLFSHVTLPYGKGGALQVDYALAKTECKLNSVTLGISVYASIKQMLAAADAELKKLCPDCKNTTVDLDPAKIAANGGATTQTALNRDSGINYVIASSDSVAFQAVPAIAQAGKAEDVPVIGFNGDPANLKLVQEGKQAADIAGPPLNYQGWAELDTLGRGILKMKAEVNALPLQIFDQSNLPAGSEPYSEFGDYRAGFKQNWGVG
jgi:ribose transport system substrate-binding protein